MKRNAVTLLALLAVTSADAAGADNSFCINHVVKKFNEKNGVLISWEAPSGEIKTGLAGVKLADKQFPANDQVKNAVADVICSIEAVGVNAFLNKRFERTLFDEEPAWLLGSSNVVRKNSYVTEIVETTEAERQRLSRNGVPYQMLILRYQSAENLKPDEYGFRNGEECLADYETYPSTKIDMDWNGAGYAGVPDLGYVSATLLQAGSIDGLRNEIRGSSLSGHDDLIIWGLPSFHSLTYDGEEVEVAIYVGEPRQLVDDWETNYPSAHFKNAKKGYFDAFEGRLDLVKIAEDVKPFDRSFDVLESRAASELEQIPLCQEAIKEARQRILTR